MAAAVDHSRYNNLASLEEANIARQASFVDDVINGPIRDVFLKHGVHNAFCLYLQHRHHTVGADEAVVKVNGTAHLMDNQAMRDIVSFGNKVVPTTWMVSGGEVLPMEFMAVPAGTVFSCPSPAFLKEFVSVLASNGCNNLFGIDTIAEYPWSEMKIGDASVVVPSGNGIKGLTQEDFIPVAFAFDNEKPSFKVHGRCKRNHQHTTRPRPKLW